MKTIKVKAATHRELKIRALQNNVPMVGYLKVALNSIWDFKDEKISKDLFIEDIMNIKDRLNEIKTAEKAVKCKKKDA